MFSNVSLVLCCMSQELGMKLEAKVGWGLEQAGQVEGLCLWLRMEGAEL